MKNTIFKKIQDIQDIQEIAYSTQDEEFFQTMTFPQLLSIHETNEDIKNFLRRFPATQRILESIKNKNDLIQKIRIQELLYEYISKNTENNVLYKDISSIISDIKSLVLNTNVKLLTQLPSGPNLPYKNDFIKRFQEMKQYMNDIEIYGQMNNGSVIQPELLKNVSKSIAQDISIYNTFSSALSDLNDNKHISNEYWQNEALKYSSNKEEKFAKESDFGKQTDGSLFESILKCKENKSMCSTSNINKFLKIGLERIKNNKLSKDKKTSSKTDTYNVHQSYVFINVIKGIVNEENNNLVFCKGADTFFGDYIFKEEDVTEKEKDEIKNAIFMDLEEKIKEVNSTLANKSKTMKNKPSSKSKSKTRKNL